jgi:hypothetical protein
MFLGMEMVISGGGRFCGGAVIRAFVPLFLIN